jgi:hypothetical protein
MKLTLLDRILLLLTGLLAAYQIAVGIDRLDALPIAAYTVGFGVVLVASLLIIILGWEALDSPIVVILSTVIPLSLSLGLVWDLLPAYRTGYLVFVMLGFLAVGITRTLPLNGNLPAIVLSIVHGLAGLTIFLLPVAWSLAGRAPVGFALVSIGGALIGLGGLSLSFLKIGKPILSRKTILKILPGLLLLTTAAFVLGFSFT